MEIPSELAKRFTILREQGRGTSGVVCQARDSTTDTLVALKLIEGRDAEALERFVNETSLLKRLEHAHVVRIVDSGVTEDQQAWIAMEWLDGETLEERQHRAPLDLSESLELMADLADALSAAHALGVIHRDVKPANVFVSYPAPEKPFPKLLDFGAAAQIDRQRLTEATVIGTPAYMAPEQVRGDASVDARADLYALGATLYELLGGQPPHRGPTHLATLARLATTQPRRLREVNPAIPPPIDDFVAQLLAPFPEQRPESAEVVSAQLRQLAAQAQRDAFVEAEPRSFGLGSTVSRIITTIVALDFPAAGARDQALPTLASRGVAAVPLARDALVAHLGVRALQGNEASMALRLSQRLARAGARVGVATGRAVVTFADLENPNLPIGEVVDRAMSLAHRALAEQILADATTSELARGKYEFGVRPDGSAVVKGRLTQTRTDTGGGTPFVGRDSELARVKAGFERALSESRAIVISISGPPGIGKTRLQREAIARVSASFDVRSMIHQRNEAYGQRRALGAAADVVRALLRVPKGADPDSCGAAVRAALDPGVVTEQQIKILGRLISGGQLLEAKGARDYRDALWLAMTQVVGRNLENGSVLIVAEDLQWADPESIAWFEHILTRFGDQPLALLFTARQTFWNDYSERFQSLPHVKLELHPISDLATQAIAAAVLGEHVSSDKLNRIVEQSSGLPLFAEELSRLAAVGKDLQLAPTIESAIQASLDSLTKAERDAVGRFSVFGQAGWDEALEALGVEEPEHVLAQLCRQEVLVEQDSSRFVGLREWHFKHALVRDVAYNCLGAVQRKELHSLAAQWLQTAGEDATVVAGHFDLAGSPEKAAVHWALAARRALAANALPDALSLSERALAFSVEGAEAFERAQIWDEAWSLHDARASDRESAIMAMEEHAHDEITRTYARGARVRYDLARGQAAEVDAQLEAVIETARRLNLVDEEARCAAELARRKAFAGLFEQAEAQAARLLKLSRHEGMRAAAVDAWQTFAIVRQSGGALSAALDARRSAVKAAKEAALTERESILTTNLGFALTTVGARVEAREHLSRGLTLAEEIGSLGAKRHAMMLLLCWAAAFGSDRELDATLGEVREEADAAAGAMWTAPARENLGNIYYRGVELLRHPTQRNIERSRALLSQASESYRQTRNRDVLAVALGMWARAELSAGNVDVALRLAKEASNLLASEAHSLLNESPVYLVLHDTWLAIGDEAAAIQAVQEGMEPLMRRIRGLAQTPYVRPFLTELSDNARLIANAESYGVMPERVREFLGRDAC